MDDAWVSVSSDGVVVNGGVCRLTMHDAIYSGEESLPFVIDQRKYRSCSDLVFLAGSS